jgi:hypothetical protein
VRNAGLEGMQKGYTREHAEAIACVLNSWLAHLVTEIAVDRRLSPAEVRMQFQFSLAGLCYTLKDAQQTPIIAKKISYA